MKCGVFPARLMSLMALWGCVKRIVCPPFYKLPCNMLTGAKRLTKNTLLMNRKSNSATLLTVGLTQIWIPVIMNKSYKTIRECSVPKSSFLRTFAFYLLIDLLC